MTLVLRLRRRPLLPIPISTPIPHPHARIPVSFPSPNPPKSHNNPYFFSSSSLPAKFPEYEMPSVSWGVIQGRKERLVSRVIISDYLKSIGVVPDELEHLELPSSVEVMRERVDFLHRLGLSVDDFNSYPLILACSVRKNMIPVLSYLKDIWKILMKPPDEIGRRISRDNVTRSGIPGGREGGGLGRRELRRRRDGKRGRDGELDPPDLFAYSYGNLHAGEGSRGGRHGRAAAENEDSGRRKARRVLERLLAERERGPRDEGGVRA